MGATALALGAQAGGQILGGMAGAAEAKGEKKRAETNAFIGRTRAIQASTSAGADLNDELATLRTTLAANGQRQGVGTFAIMQELRATRGRERRIEVGNEMASVADWKMQAKNAGARGRMAMIAGAGKAASPLYDLYQLRKG